MNYRATIGRAIIRLRKLRGISQERMAFESNIDRRYLSDIENGKRNISLDILSRIATYFGISLSVFLARAEERSHYDDSNAPLKRWLVDHGFEDSCVLENPSYRNAVIGVSETGRVIYSEKVILEDMIIDERMSSEEALDHFHHNLLRSLPYMGDRAPIIYSDLDF